MAIPKLAMIPSGYKEGKVYSVLPTNGDGDFTFSRGSSATRVNKDGLIETMTLELGEELVTNGGFDTDSDWTKGSGWTISGGKATKSGSDLAYLTQSSLVSVVGKTYKVTASITNVTAGNIRIDGFTAGGTITSDTEVNVIYTATATNPLRILGWNGFNGSIDNVSVKEVLSGYDLPRLDYTDSSCPSLLLEPQSTNLVEYSEDFSQWSALNNVVVTDNFITSPDGTQNAAKLVFDGTASGRIELSVSASGTNTQSIYLKTESGTQNVSIGAGSVDLTQFTITDQWVRYTHTGGGDFPRILCNDSATIYVYGAQLEALSYPTSYIPTNGAVATRLADVCNSAGTSDTFNDSEGVLYAEISALADDLTYRCISISDGSGSNKISLNYNNSSNNLWVYIVSGNSGQVNLITPINVAQYNKIALKYKQNDFALWVNGTEVSTDTSVLTPIGLSELNFNFTGSLPFYGNVKDVRYYNTALTEQELTDLTQV